MSDAYRTSCDGSESYHTSCVDPEGYFGYEPWTVYVRYDNYDRYGCYRRKYEITIPTVEISNDSKQEERIRYIKANSKNTNVRIDFMNTYTNQTYSKTFNNKYISKLIYKIHDLIDKSSCADALKIERVYHPSDTEGGERVYSEKDSRSYIIKYLVDVAAIFDWKYYKLYEDYETIDKVTIEYTTKYDKDINEKVYTVNKTTNTIHNYDKYNKWDGFLQNILSNLREIQTKFIAKMDKTGRKVSLVIDDVGVA